MAKQQEQSTEVAIRQEQALALHAQMAAEAGTGFEEAGGEAYSIPFVSILQAMSPQKNKRDPKYVEGAEEGMLYNNVTNEVYDGEKGLVVIPVHYAQRFVEWKSRDVGGGFVREYAPGTEPTNAVKDDKGRDVLPNGNNLVDTRNHYLLVRREDGTWFPVVVAMSSSQLKVSRKWMSVMRDIKIPVQGGFAQAPMFSRMYRLTTVGETNAKGSYFNYKLEMEGIVEDPAVLQEAIAFRNAVRGGTAKVQHAAPDFVDEDDTQF